MGFDQHFKPLLSTGLSSSAINEPRQHHKISWEHQESNPGLLGAKRERYPLCYAAPRVTNFLSLPHIRSLWPSLTQEIGSHLSKRSKSWRQTRDQRKKRSNVFFRFNRNVRSSQQSDLELLLLKLHYGSQWSVLCSEKWIFGHCGWIILQLPRGIAAISALDVHLKYLLSLFHWK